MSKPELHSESRRRGDTNPVQYAAKDAAGAIRDITSHSFTLTVDPSEGAPTGANNLFTSTGTIINASTGRVDFPISTANADQTPGNYFYEVQMIDAGGLITTITSGQWRVVQDVVK